MHYELNDIESNEMVMTNAIQEIFRNNELQELSILRELDCWQGRADIVLARTNNAWYVPPGGAELISRLGTAQILSVLYPKRPRNIDRVAELTGLSSKTVRRSLRELVSAEMASEVKPGFYTLHPNLRLPKVEFHAYEAKLHNWKRALYQAINYYGFAQYSSVIMPEKYVAAALKNSYSFIMNGVGLFTIGKNGIDMHIKPKKNRPRKKAFHIVGIGKLLAFDEQHSNISLCSK
ncbi:hypothetical protein [Desulfosporosinus sp.]|uniref:hypothetical protein n=1 Tax=Desulfosporosinus sp. TaxID=157907 RepID=UPI002630EB31|nr:hypothetical protein [Desulfosporosinus sp.]